jgi:hypothetical protein
MKKIFLSLVIILAANAVQAKWVKYVVMLNGITPSPNGIHVAGDWQLTAGFSGNWNTGDCLMTGDTINNTYTFYTQLPANAKYEYKFVNGDQNYEYEFVPLESRVDYVIGGAVDNRWFYLDSIANDTTTIGGFIFGTNAPVGMHLVRFVVDYNNVTLTTLPKVRAAYNNWQPQQSLYSFGNNIYQNYYYQSTANVQPWIYTNSAGVAEAVPGNCSNNAGHRFYYGSTDTVLAKVCFASCAACSTANITQLPSKQQLSISPIPTTGNITISNMQARQVYTVYNSYGMAVIQFTPSQDTHTLNVDTLASGMYYLSNAGATAIHKFVKY